MIFIKSLSEVDPDQFNAVITEATGYPGGSPWYTFVGMLDEAYPQYKNDPEKNVSVTYYINLYNTHMSKKIPTNEQLVKFIEESCCTPVGHYVKLYGGVEEYVEKLKKTPPFLNPEFTNVYELWVNKYINHYAKLSPLQKEKKNPPRIINS